MFLYKEIFLIIRFCENRINTFERVTTQTEIKSSSRGFSFCIKSAHVREYASGLSTGGISGEKNNMIDRNINCTTMF